MGKVILVGAGPGALGLLTLRGKEAIENADVVLYDRLVSQEIIALIPESAEAIDVGKRAGNHPVPQHEINAMILKFAREGKQVTRLKGGDPYLFGRGAEELETLLPENIPFEVVPGVTSALAAPAFAGIPVSHRDIASSVHIITAHGKNNTDPDINYESLVKLGGTLIFLMGLETIEAVSGGLLKAGMSGSTPAALIENGTRPNQRKTIATVATIARRAKEEAVKSPAAFMVGGVIALSEKLDWFSALPLFGASIAVTRPKTESLLSRKLRALGALVTDTPSIKTEPLPLEEALFTSLAEYNWIVFTSPTGAELFFESLKQRRLDIRITHKARFAAVGAKTSEALEKRGIILDYTPESYNGKSLAAGLPSPTAETGKLLLFRAEDGSPEIPAALRERGFKVTDVSAYKTIRGCDKADEAEEALRQAKLDFVAFTSGSTVQGFTASFPNIDFREITAICIGEETSAQAREKGFPVLVSEQSSIDSMVELIQAEWKRRRA